MEVNLQNILISPPRDSECHRPARYNMGRSAAAADLPMWDGKGANTQFDIGRQLLKHACATIGAITGHHESAVRKPPGYHLNHFDRQFRPCAMVFLSILDTIDTLALCQPLPISVEAKAYGQAPDFGWGPKGRSHDQAQDHPIVGLAHELHAAA